MTEPMEAAINGTEVPCLESNQYQIYECRPESICLGCGLRNRIEAAESERDLLRKQLDAREAELASARSEVANWESHMAKCCEGCEWCKPPAEQAGAEDCTNVALKFEQTTQSQCHQSADDGQADDEPSGRREP